MRYHYRQNSASVTFINGASVFLNGALILKMVPLIFVIGASVFVNDTSSLVYGASIFVNIQRSGNNFRLT